MDDWSRVAAIVVPLVLNWLEVRKLRKEVEAQRLMHESELSQVKRDLSKMQSEVREIQELLTAVAQ